MELVDIDHKIHNCNCCGDIVEKFPNSTTIFIGKKNDIVILGEAPANNGWRKSGIAWYDQNHKLLPSGVVLQKLLELADYNLEDTIFLEAIKCYPKERKYLKQCANNCKNYLLEQINLINPKIILPLGVTATQTILDTNNKKLSEIVGKSFSIDGYEIIPIYHPSPISPLSYKGNEEIFKTVIKEKVKQLKK